VLAQHGRKEAGNQQETRCNYQRQVAPWQPSFPCGSAPMLIGYVRVSKSDGSQTLSPQCDVMLQAGVEPERIYHDLAPGRHDARPGLQSCLKPLQPGNTLVL